jgi:hypothetical protein
MRRTTLALLLLCACPESEQQPQAIAEAPSATAQPTSTTTAAPSTTAAASATAAPSVSAKPEDELAPPPLLDAEGQPLPQTEDEPSVDNPIFQDRMKRLWEAIVADDPEKVRDFCFPVEAYSQVKGIEKPERDWKYRLWKNFKRDIHKYHQRLGKKRGEAKLLEIEVRTKPKWMKPGSEGNLIGYWRVTRSFIHYENAEGKKRRFDLTSMISWRGHWYVVHLHGFE